MITLMFAFGGSAAGYLAGAAGWRWYGRRRARLAATRVANLLDAIFSGQATVGCNCPSCNTRRDAQRETRN